MKENERNGLKLKDITRKINICVDFFIYIINGYTKYTIVIILQYSNYFTII